MNPSDTEDAAVEPDTRFPSGPWTGFFLQPNLPGRQWMELNLTFHEGLLRGEGRDVVGSFQIRGKYTLDDGKCWWTKDYVGKHTISYQGFNESKGIWGIWEYETAWRGGFHIWPVAMGDPTLSRLEVAIDEPAPGLAPSNPADVTTVPTEVGEPVASELGGLLGNPIGEDDSPVP